jgi:hypothetical protein
MIWKTSGKRMKQKYQTKWKASKLEQAEDRISEQEDEMEINGTISQTTQDL